MSVDALDIDVPIAKAFDFLLTQRARYKVVRGGRGKGASWSFVRALLVRGMERPTRILACREIQRTIADSVHQLFADQIATLNLGTHYKVMEKEIRATNGTTIGYAGLRHNITELKSWEGADIAMVAEATNVSKGSWTVLTPTIRKPGSEIWVEYNPELESDETEQRFAGKNPPADSIIKTLTWRDNPFITAELLAEKADLEQRDPAEYLVVWEGKTRQALTDAIYADELIAADRDGRICKMPHNAALPVDVFADLGHANNTSLWFVQKVGFEYHVIDYYENHLKKIGHYLEEMQQRRYLYGNIYLPHDAANEQPGAESIEKQVDAVYRGKVIIVPRVEDKNQTHNAVKTVFPSCYFDRDKCADGLQGLRHYRYKRDPRTGAISRDPLHNWASDTADGFGTFALSKNLGKKQHRPRASLKPRFVEATKTPSQKWMGS